MKRPLAIRFAMALAALGGLQLLPGALAHPVPRKMHDRTVEVRLSSGREDSQLIIDVRYRLEVDEFTVVFDDLPAIASKNDLRTFEKPNQFFEAFLRLYGPILAANCDVTLDGDPLKLAVPRSAYTLRDEKGVPLDHLRCDFLFQAKAKLREQPGPHRLIFREGNYELEEGKIRLSLVADPRIQVESKIEPDSVLMERPAADLKPGDDARLRCVEINFRLLPATGDIPSSQGSPGPPVQAPDDSTAQEPEAGSPLLSLLLNSNQGIAVLLLMAAGFGAAHALTPGHGKTLVAAYLVGERGTAWHAVVLGLATTISHTGIVILLATILLVLFPAAVPKHIQMTLGFVGGLMITAMGLWLLLRRLGGGADHIHIGGGHHHHHGPENIAGISTDSEKTGLLGVIVLGISGGIVPCWDAIIMLGLAISAQRLWLGVPLLLAFSAGLAAVLVALGLAIVYLKGFAASRKPSSLIVRWLPLASAALVTALGLGLCYDSIHPRGSSARDVEPASLRSLGRN